MPFGESRWLSRYYFDWDRFERVSTGIGDLVFRLVSLGIGEGLGSGTESSGRVRWKGWWSLDLVLETQLFLSYIFFLSVLVTCLCLANPVQRTQRSYLFSALVWALQVPLFLLCCFAIEFAFLIVFLRAFTPIQLLMFCFCFVCCLCMDSVQVATDLARSLTR